ncbi:MAG: hypothetical protein KKA73_01265 [Chloroflexi bacterium]|nr:hypothetical protein [Chloroflexota bacterium]MBU1746294.1 hypothetical protein [Chloroflexota bacterium]MBU1878279.1 hypothetical protein [Chloroflexota bacterium]
MKLKSRSLWPALTLFFLAPTIGELLSSSAPPAEFFNPVVLFLLAALYGSGALLIRELRVRWNKGWLTVLALGAAYGIIEEGLVVKSFFDPNWMDLGLLGSYGRWAGVNWVWALELTLYHAVFSITIPILLTELLFPARRDERWVGRWGMVGLSLLLLTDGLLIFFLLTPYGPPLVPYALAVVAVVALVLIARWLPAPREPRPGRVRRPLWFALVGLGGTFAFFFTLWLLPETGLPAALTMLALVGLVVLVAGLVRWLSRRGTRTDQHRLALAGGALAFFVLLTPLIELDTARADNPAGMMLVGLVTLLFLVGLWWKVRRMVRRQTLDATT